MVTVHPEDRKAFEKTMPEEAWGVVGTVRKDDRFDVIGLAGETVIQTTIWTLKEAWQKPLT